MSREKIEAGRYESMKHSNSNRHGKAGIALFFLLACAALAFWAPNANAQSNYYVDRGCSTCHGATPTTCNGCHEHGVRGRTGSPQSATVNKTTFAPGENVIVTLRGGRTSSATNGTGGWVRGILYRDNVEIARSAGTVAPGNIGPSGGSGLPITFTTAAPTTPGTYTYAAAWYGNTANNGAGFPGNHGEVRAPAITITVAAATVAGPMTVTPAGGLTSTGTAGGPFSPSSQAYTLTNTGTAPMNWTATKVQSWVTLSAAGGTLAAGANTTVTASINSGANSLAAGGYTDTVTFTNTTNGTGNTTRAVGLTVNAVTLSSIAISGATSVNENTTSQYTATATWSNATTTNVTSLATWSTNIGTISTGGLLSAPAVTGNQTATINASYTSGVTRTAPPVGVTIVDVTPTLAITTTSLPAGAVGKAYNQALAATGGTTPYSWSVSAGTLPAGLSLSTGGVLSGTPTSAASTNFTVQVTGGGTATKQFSATIKLALNPALIDFDGDSKTDVAVWRPSSGIWYAIDSSGGTTSSKWGVASDDTVPGDYDGDGKTDYAVWRPSSGIWYILRSSDGTTDARQWGTVGDITVPGDYDGDGKTDLAVWRPSTGTWFILRSSDGGIITQQWGLGSLNDVPVPGDYDGDGKTDIAVFRPPTGYWHILRSSDQVVVSSHWGTSGDTPVPGDYDGDGKTDIAVYRPSDSYWFKQLSSVGVFDYDVYPGDRSPALWGASTDVPVPGDYDGDRRTDIAVWRPSSGMWYILRSSIGTMDARQWGLGSLNDDPIKSK